MVRVAVILPMYNEAGNVAALFERLAAVRASSGLALTAIAVDDGSRDNTYERIDQAASSYPFVRVCRHARNRGMAAALRTGIAVALSEPGCGFDALAFMDADLTHAPEDLAKLIAPIARDDADFVLGSRYVAGGGMRGVPLGRRVVSVIGNAVVRRMLGVPVGDLTSGFRAGRADVFRAIALEEKGFGIQLEGTVKAYRAGFRIAEVPITLGVRKTGYSKMAYTRSFWLGYARLVVKLWLASRRGGLAGQRTAAWLGQPPVTRPPGSTGAGAVLDSLARISYAEVEDP
jgi:dolichol-phosphate mannosyltransferase